MTKTTPGARRAAGAPPSPSERAHAARRRRCPLEPATDPSKAPAERRKGAYVLPPLTLLDAAKDQHKIDERELMDAARLLEEKCREFSVEGSVVQIHPGPVVTTYEFKPDAGVKYSRITSLADDLCLAMRAESVLIDRIPGKSTVGIQIPEPAPGDDHAARAARIGHLHARDVAPHDGPGQDDPRRALRQRSRHDAAPADRRIDRRRQVGERERDGDQHPVPLLARGRAASS